MLAAQIFVALLFAYATTGLLFAAWFLVKGVGRLDEGMALANWKVRILLLPGSIAFWPVLLKKLADGPESNALKAAYPSVHALTLRRRHRQIWIGMALVLPVLFGLAIAVIPETPVGEPTAAHPEPALGEALKSADTESLFFQLRADSAGYKQLEITVKKPLPAPVATVSANGQILGALSSRGVYRFPLAQNLPVQIKVVDPVHKSKLAPPVDF
jgi:hypothetical protein